MVDVFRVAEALVNHVKSKYSEDIALIAYYGSYALGKATEKSDLDFFFIPSTNEGLNANFQFILDDIGFDFWPLSWERAERIASFVEPMATIIADSKIIYTHSQEDMERFIQLRETITRMLESDNYRNMIEKAAKEVRDSYVHLYRINRESNLKFIRLETSLLLKKVFQSLAFLNSTYFTRGWGQNMDQIQQLPLKPKKFEQLVKIIMTDQNINNIQDACEKLVSGNRDLVLKVQEGQHGTPSYSGRLKGFYEEAKGTLNKILTACEKNDYETAFFSSIHMQDEISRFLVFAEIGSWPNELDSSRKAHRLYSKYGLPDLISSLDPENLNPLKLAVESLDNIFREFLLSKGIVTN